MTHPAVPTARSTFALAGTAHDRSSGQPPAPSSFFWIDPTSTTSLDDLAGRFAEAASLGFDGVLLAAPFATEPDRDAQDDPLLLAPDGGPGEPALAALAAAAHRQGLALCLELRLDRIAPTAAIARQHPDWFVYTAEGVGFSFITETDAALAWWDEQFAGFQALGVDGICLHAAHRLPPAAATRLIRDARTRRPGWLVLATTFGATPSELAALAPCGFDFLASSSCWWDGRAPWLADDLARVAAVAPVATFVAPPLMPAPPPDRRALGLAGFLGSAWVLNAPVPPEAHDMVAAINRLRRERRNFFAGPPDCVSPPHATPTLFARFDRGRAGLALAFGGTDDARDPSRLRAWLGDRAAAIELLAEDALTDAGLALFITAPLPVVYPATESRPGVAAALAASRIAIEAVTPAVDDGRFPVKRIAGDHVTVEADLVCDGHGQLAADLLWRTVEDTVWQRAPMAPLVNDRWTAGFDLAAVGRIEFTIETWVDRYGAYVDEIAKKHAAGVAIALELIEGMALLDAAIALAPPAHEKVLIELRTGLQERPTEEQVAILTAPSIVAVMREVERRRFITRLERPIPIDAERRAAGFSSWYEIFPRSQSGDENRHGTFDDVIAALPRIRAMGFDVLYFPPIHPIGRKNRKGRNNSLTATETEPGSPYAIGAEEGGHDAIHPELGSFADFRRLVAAAADHGLEIALDFAIQCAPDHPWLREHPGWFDWRPDGTIKYAENPPKKYEDIVNVDFYTDGAKPSLWVALRNVVAFWVEQGVRIFRVDNPHTKPFPFWEWMIGDIRARHPDTIFLAEAFTRPKLMYRLAKIGFSQSYTYFTWRNSAPEMREYLTELTQTAPRDFFRPHFFVNTPDINPVFLQNSGRPGFLIRAALAATLSGLWGVYNGFELCEGASLPGREEYLDSEKYQIRVWDYDRPGNIVAEIAALNRIRRQNPALHSHLGITFLPCSNDNILYFTKSTPDRENVLLVAISFDPFNRQNGEIELPLADFGFDDNGALVAEDLARGVDFVWHGKRQIVSIDPSELPYCIWRIRA